MVTAATVCGSGRRLRILVAYNATRQRTGGMSRIMGLIHDELALAGHSVDYFCAEELPGALLWRLGTIYLSARIGAPRTGGRPGAAVPTT